MRIDVGGVGSRTISLVQRPFGRGRFAFFFGGRRVAVFEARFLASFGLLSLELFADRFFAGGFPGAIPALPVRARMAIGPGGGSSVGIWSDSMPWVWDARKKA
jgi:hypothetical protein